MLHFASLSLSLTCSTVLQYNTGCQKIMQSCLVKPAVIKQMHNIRFEHFQFYLLCREREEKEADKKQTDTYLFDQELQNADRLC